MENIINNYKIKLYFLFLFFRKINGKNKILGNNLDRKVISDKEVEELLIKMQEEMIVDTSIIDKQNKKLSPLNMKGLISQVRVSQLGEEVNILKSLSKEQDRESINNTFKENQNILK